MTYHYSLSGTYIVIPMAYNGYGQNTTIFNNELLVREPRRRPNMGAVYPSDSDPHHEDSDIKGSCSEY